MPTIEELLRNTLKEVNDTSVTQAAGDLHRAVVEVMKATESISRGTLTLFLRGPGAAADRRADYGLYITYRNNNPRFVAAYTVPRAGYPIAVRYHVEGQELALHDDRIKPDEQIESPEQLSEHFRRMATDPNSPLVYYLAYAVRQLEEGPAEEEPADVK